MLLIVVHFGLAEASLPSCSTQGPAQLPLYSPLWPPACPAGTCTAISSYSCPTRQIWKAGFPCSLGWWSVFEVGWEWDHSPFAVLLTVLLLSLYFPQRVRTTLSQVSVSLPFAYCVYFVVVVPPALLWLTGSWRKNQEARSKLVEVAQSPGFPMHKQNGWGAFWVISRAQEMLTSL